MITEDVQVNQTKPRQIRHNQETINQKQNKPN